MRCRPLLLAQAIELGDAILCAFSSADLLCLRLLCLSLRNGDVLALLGFEGFEADALAHLLFLAAHDVHLSRRARHARVQPSHVTHVHDMIEV